MKINDLFYLESYIITETKKKKFILINTLDGSFMTFEYSNSLKRVVDELLKDGNNYCIKITKEHLEDRYIKIFIEETKKKYFSDTIDSKITLSKPFIAQPIKNYQTDINRIEKQTLLYGGNITSKLNELTIFINSYCNQNCTLCKDFHKQTIFCTKIHNEILSFNKIKKLVDEINPYNNINQINIVGANIFYYKSIIDLHDLFIKRGMNIKYYIHISSINIKKDWIIKTIKDLKDVIILINFPVEIKKIEEIESSLKILNIHYKYKVIIENEKQYSQIHKYFFLNQIEYFEIIPLYNGNNLSFFKKFIFIHIDDLKLKKIIKNQYFANQTFNINNYGKITILSNGDFYANLNQPKLGNINKDSLYDVLCLEIYNGKSWNFIRNVTPCKECVFQYICPPISNYELVIGKYDLCHVS